MKAAFFDDSGAITSVDVILDSNSETIVEYDGTKGFKAVLLNY